MKLPTPKTQSAFTLIELLVVISIIAILAGIALPVFSEVQIKGAQANVLSNAKQVGLACKLWGEDYSGTYPGYELDANNKITSKQLSDSNAVFAQLFDSGYIKTEKIFYCAKSKFTPIPPDEKFANPGDILKQGENHFAYVLGNNSTSNANFPLIADGFASEGSHTYDKDPEKKGGVWKGKKAIVVHCDNSAEIALLNKQLKVPGNPNGDDLFATGVADWMGADSKVVNPK